MPQDDVEPTPNANPPNDNTNRSKWNRTLGILGVCLLLAAFFCACKSGSWFYHAKGARIQFNEMKLDQNLARSVSRITGRKKRGNVFGAMSDGLGAVGNLAGMTSILLVERQAYQFLSFTLFFGFAGYEVLRFKKRSLISR